MISTFYLTRNRATFPKWREIDSQAYCDLDRLMRTWPALCESDELQIASSRLPPIPPSILTPAEMDALHPTPEEEKSIDKCWAGVTDTEWTDPKHVAADKKLIADAMAEQAEALNDVIDLCEGQMPPAAPQQHLLPGDDHVAA